jgi:hydroxymethylglutaryl-CoA lyase
MIPSGRQGAPIEALAVHRAAHIACVSYVNPKRVPTMADAEEVASKIRQKPGIEYAALCSTSKVSKRLRGPLHVDGGVRVTASDTFAQEHPASPCPTPWSSSACR